MHNHKLQPTATPLLGCALGAKGEEAGLQHRPAEQRDLEVICTFPRSEAELFYFYPKARYPLTLRQLEEAVEQRVNSTVVEQDGDVVGFANFYRWDGGVCCIGNVVVAPQARGQGVARYLVRTMLSLARSEHNAAEVRISCFNSNTPGLLLYAGLGFVPFAVEERAGPDDARVALIHMRYQEEPNQVLEPTE
ncbi:MAG: GNAT family N-acetyltransferase [Ectothiorhodospiraceae bacterium]|nr:GNAT family N-acetyltransferase [Ectothiorhodospiraceae bacterium]